MRTVFVGGDKQRVPETERELAGQNVAAAVKALGLAVAMKRLKSSALTEAEENTIRRLYEEAYYLAAQLGYEVRS
jgi:hypothetical protein